MFPTITRGALAIALSLATPAHAQNAPAPDEAVPVTPALVEAKQVEAGDLVITRAWTRQAPPGARVGGGYLSVTNRGDRPDRLVGGAAAFAGRVEIHEMSVTDGVMRMAPVEGGLEIAPGETVELKPGGFHVMFMDVKESPRAGDTVPVTLSFQRAGDVTVSMPVAPIGATSPNGPAGKGMGGKDMPQGGMPQGGMSHGEGMSHGGTRQTDD